jgi:thioredoxin 1
MEKKIMSENIVKLDTDNFDKEIYQSDTPCFVQFSTPWCAPCRTFAPIMASLSEQFNGKCKFGKIDAEENMELAYKFNISSVPTMLIFKKDQVVERINGLVPRDNLVSKIENVLQS